MGPTSHMDLCLNLIQKIPTLSSDLDASPARAKAAIDCWGKSLHHKRWAEERTCRHLRLFMPDPYHKDRGNIFDLSRSTLQLLVQVVTGHNFLNYHLYKLRLAPSPVCSCGQGEESGFHFIAACDKYAFLRLLELGSARLSAEDLQSMSLVDLAHFIVRSGRLISSRGGSMNREVTTPSSQ